MRVSLCINLHSPGLSAGVGLGGDRERYRVCLLTGKHFYTNFFSTTEHTFSHSTLPHFHIATFSTLPDFHIATFPYFHISTLPHFTHWHVSTLPDYHSTCTCNTNIIQDTFPHCHAHFHIIRIPKLPHFQTTKVADMIILIQTVQHIMVATNITSQNFLTFP